MKSPPDTETGRPFAEDLLNKNTEVRSPIPAQEDSLIGRCR